MTKALVFGSLRMPSHPIEAALGWFISIISSWMMAFGWFQTYLRSMHDYAGMEWAIGIPMLIYGLLQVHVALHGPQILRFFCCIVSGLIFFVFLSASIYENGWLGLHVPAFGFCVFCHMWAWLKITGVIRSGAH